MAFSKALAASLFIGVSAAILASSARAQEGGDGPILRGDDKFAHFGVSAAGTAGMIKTFQAFDDQHQITTGNRVAASVIMLVFGLAKEADDIRRHGNGVLRDSRGDFLADAMGTVVGQFIQWEF